MTPSARAQAAIELLDLIIDGARSNGGAADNLIARYFKERRYAGSGDRRAVRELVYRAIRRAGEVPASGRAALAGLASDDEALAALFDGSPHGPVLLAEDEPRAPAALFPAWLDSLIDPAIAAGEQAAMLARAPLVLRVNRLRGTREDASALLPEATPTPHSPIGLRLPEGFRVDQHDAWKSGLVEVQDEGSQLLAFACAAKPGEVAVDLCAGAGGKTLALAAEMANQGSLIAADTDRGRRCDPRVVCHLRHAGLRRRQRHRAPHRACRPPRARLIRGWRHREPRHALGHRLRRRAGRLQGAVGHRRWRHGRSRLHEDPARGHRL